MGEEIIRAVGLFWDIENCHVPRNVSALAVVRRLREKFFTGLREAEFMCVCDISKESKNVIEGLNNGQVNVVHINATAKNAADDKIRQSLRRFADNHPPETRIILISGDVNFATELSDLRHRKQMYIILLHGKQVHEALVNCAHEHYVYDDVVADLPFRPVSKPLQNLRLVVRGYPHTFSLDLIKKRLTTLSNNCGGKVVAINKDKACIEFPTQDATNRAKRRLEGEDVYGMPISVTTSAIDEAITARFSPSKYKAGGNSVGEGVVTRSRSRESRHLSPAPGAPGSTSPVKQYRGQQSSVNAAYNTSQNSHAYSSQSSFSTQQGVFQNETPYQQSEDNSLQVTPAIILKRDATLDQPLQPKGKTMVHNASLLQHPSFPGRVENQSGRSSESQLTSQTQCPNPAAAPLLYNQFSNTVPICTTAVGVPANLNVAKPYNMAFQPNYTPRLYYPQPLYPYQQTSTRQSAFTSGPRQSTGPSYNSYNRPRSQNSCAGSFNSQQQSQPQQNRPYSARGLSSTSDVFDDDEDDGLEAAYFKAQQQSGERDGPVDLTVTNLDYNISKKEWRKILAATFQPQVQVLGICVRTQADNTSIASVKVSSIEDARYAISQFHRRKIGYKRINVTLNDDKEQAPAESTRQEAIAILSDAKAYTMPVFKFIENYEKRYHKSVSVSDLYKMKDIVDIMDRGGAGRMVRLAKGICPTPSPTPDDAMDSLQEEGLDQPVCLYHCPEGSPQYAEAMSIGMLPNVRLQRKHFAAHVHSLLLSHNGVMPLMSFPICYGAVFGIIPASEESGVPMEHLISCVPGVEIVLSKKGVKLVHFQENKDPPGAEAICGRTSPMLSQQMALLSREIGDLLRQTRTCSIPASKFIPAYHHHFGRQCRVADYGYTKLAELFDALPHVLQVLGTGDRKVLTLSHRAQVKRFIADVLKVLKTQPGKMMAVSDLPSVFERLLFRKFDITHYGVSFIEDMFMDIPPTSILVTVEGNKTVMAIPKRDQTPEEMKRTEQFALELVDLLKHNPQCRMIFNRFIPAYHHHFGRQCRVADYGFTRLTDLFESIPQVVEIIDDEEERMIKLTAPEMRRVLAEQMTGLLKENPNQTLPVSDVLLAFQRQYGFPLRLSDFGVHDVKSLLGKIKHAVFINMRNEVPLVELQPAQDMPELAVRVVQLLMDQSGGCLPLVELCSRYRGMFGVECEVQKIQDELLDYVQISTESDDGSALIRLSALQILGRDLRTMLKKHGCIPLSMIGQVYQEQFFVELKPALYGFPDIPSLLKALPHIVKLTGRLGRKFVELSPLSASGNEDDELVQISRVSSFNRFEDYLSAPVPSAIPSPELQPSQNMNLPDLMSFEQSDFGDKVWDMSEEEKKGLGTPLCRTPTSELLHMAAAPLPNPEPPPPIESIFPGNVPLTAPFPPPPPLPTDIAPPPLTEGRKSNAQWPPFLWHAAPPPPVSQKSAPSTASSDRSRYSAPVSSYQEPAGLEELPAASLQWKEMLEKGWWKPTPQQLNNLASMGLLGLGQTYGRGNNDLTQKSSTSEVQKRSTSAPDFNKTSRIFEWKNSIESDFKKPGPVAVSDSANPQSVSESVLSCPTMTVTADASVLSADPSIVKSSLYSPVFSTAVEQSVDIKSGPAFQGSQLSSLPSNALKMAQGEGGMIRGMGLGEELEQVFEESLSISGEGDITVLEKSVKQVPFASPDISPLSHSWEASQSKGAAASAVDQVASLVTLSQKALSSKQQHHQQTSSVMTAAGDASSALNNIETAEVSGLSEKPEAMDSASFCSIPANDSFSLNQPLDTSSVRSSGSSRSLGSGSFSDAVSTSPSPKKTPRRAHLAPTFFNPRK